MVETSYFGRKVGWETIYYILLMLNYTLFMFNKTAVCKRWGFGRPMNGSGILFGEKIFFVWEHQSLGDLITKLEACQITNNSQDTWVWRAGLGLEFTVKEAYQIMYYKDDLDDDGFYKVLWITKAL